MPIWAVVPKAPRPAVEPAGRGLASANRFSDRTLGRARKHSAVLAGGKIAASQTRRWAAGLSAWFRAACVCVARRPGRGATGRSGASAFAMRTQRWWPGRGGNQRRRLPIQQRQEAFSLLFGGRAQPPKITHAWEALRQDVLEETANKFRGRQGERFPVPRVAAAKTKRNAAMRTSSNTVQVGPSLRQSRKKERSAHLASFIGEAV